MASSDRMQRSGLGRRLARKVASLWMVHVRRDRQARAFRRWFADRGDETLRLDYPDLGRDSLVVDAGGFHGEWAGAIRDRYRCRVAVFEPVAGFAGLLRRRFAGDEAVTIVQAGLAGADGRRRIRVDGDASSSAGGGDGGHEEECEFIAADRWFSEQRVATVDLLKVNIEGGEFELFEHLLDRGLMPRIRHLQVQFHRFVPQADARRAAIRQRLAQTHRCTWDYHFVWENWTLIAS